MSLLNIVKKGTCRSADDAGRLRPEEESDNSARSADDAGRLRPEEESDGSA